MERLKDKTLSGRQRQRLSAVQLGLEGELSLPQIARAVGAGARSVSRWHALYREAGLQRLVEERRGRGPKSQLDEQSAAKLRQKLAEGTWRRAEDARQWLQKQLGRKLTLSVTYKYLGKVEARLKVPRPLHAGKNPQAAETFPGRRPGGMGGRGPVLVPRPGRLRPVLQR